MVLGFRVQGLGFRVQGLGFRVQGLGFRVLNLRVAARFRVCSFLGFEVYRAWIPDCADCVQLQLLRVIQRLRMRRGLSRLSVSTHLLKPQLATFVYRKNL